MQLKHETVLKDEAILHLNMKKNGIYVDGTLGGGGHSEAILNHLGKSGKLFAFDQDSFAIEYAKDRLNKYENIVYVHANFKKMKKELEKHDVFGVDGILLDLGLSSFQIDDAKRGFTYLKDTALDMRMDQSSALTAEVILNSYDEKDLVELFFKYGEEKNARRIARMIIERRPLKTTMDLVKITDAINFREKGHSAKRVFQALRIAVNDELGVLESLLESSVALLNPKGRLVIITFHSLEDRIVKQFFKSKSEVYVPRHLPIIDLPKPSCHIITRKPVYPSQNELSSNSRSKSAKLRVLEKANL